MTYVIAQPCVDVKDRACVDECPVDCIYEGLVLSTSIPTSVSIVEPASQSARLRRSIMKTMCLRSGTATLLTMPPSSKTPCPGTVSRLALRVVQHGSVSSTSMLRWSPPSRPM